MSDIYKTSRKPDDTVALEIGLSGSQCHFLLCIHLGKRLGQEIDMKVNSTKYLIFFLQVILINVESMKMEVKIPCNVIIQLANWFMSTYGM